MILGMFLGVVFVMWVLYVVGLCGGDGNGLFSVDVIEKVFAAGFYGIANFVVTTVILALIFEEIVFCGYMLLLFMKFMDIILVIGVLVLIFVLIY